MAVADNMPNDTPADLARRIKDLERAVRELSSARTLDRATITAAAGLGVRTADFDGTDFAHPGTAGNYFGGDGAVLNSLYLRPGSVTNDALANPVDADIAGFSAEGASLSTTSTVKSTVTITVPAGFTKALVRADALGEAVNSTASTDYIYVDANINSISGGEMYNAVASGYGGSAFAVANRIVTGLTGGDTITCTAMSRTGFGAWAANTSNQWTIHAQAIFLR